RGFEHARAAGLLSRSELVVAAARAPRSVLAAAFLAPYAPYELRWPPDTPRSVVDIGARLSEASPGSARHVALVEAVRRLYRKSAMAADRAGDPRRCGGRPRASPTSPGPAPARRSRPGRGPARSDTPPRSRRRWARTRSS